jgi:hypothetical protein
MAKVDFKTVAQEIGAKDDKIAKARWVALGYTTECSRCGGSGHYSYCQMYGTTCFGCSGSGKMVVKPTVKLIKEAKARIAAGALDAYFERNRRINTARKMLTSMVAEAETFYNIIANDYSKAYKAKWMDHYGDVEAAAFMKLVSPFQTEANEIFWRKIKDIQRMTTEAFRGEQLVDAEVAASFIQAGIEVLKDLAARYEAAKAA